MKKIFIAEDDPFILDIAVMKLTEKGYVVEKTSDGDLVIPMLLKNKPDILLLDLTLPNKHGFEILEEIKTYEELKTIPVIIFSNENGSDIEEKVKTYGASYFFKAMTGTGELLEKIKELLDKK